MNTLHHKTRPYLYSIQFLRGIGALLILFQHIPFINTGSCGVDIFFCISGFMAMYSTTWDEGEHFFIKRLFRIVPLYSILTLLLYFTTLLSPSLFHTTKESLPHLIKSLFFIPFEISPGILQPLLRVGWTLNYEMLFYALFAISMKIHFHYRGVICAFLLTFFSLLGSFLPVDAWLPIHFWWDSILLEFVLGILGFYIITSPSLKEFFLDIVKEHCSFIIISGSVALGSMLLLQNHLNILGIRRPILFGIPSLGIMLCFLLYDKNFDSYEVSPISRFMIQLGNLSYSFYLLHYPILMFIDRQVYSLSTLSFFSLCITLGACLWIFLLSYYTNEYLELRFTHVLRKLFLRSR